VVNAFAVPGGYVYLTRGILAYVNNEAEMAGVLGHEIGHITARHSVTQLSQRQLIIASCRFNPIASEFTVRGRGRRCAESLSRSLRPE
jgi:predicted Zn-dependent protease